MVPFLGRFQPRGLLLAVLYWVLVVLVLLAVLFAAFFYLDNFLPGQGMI
ncbi:MAG: hypothetical protein ACRDIX_02450 [Actinomycetota bacterium]